MPMTRQASSCDESGRISTLKCCESPCHLSERFHLCRCHGNIARIPLVISCQIVARHGAGWRFLAACLFVPRTPNHVLSSSLTELHSPLQCPTTWMLSVSLASAYPLHSQKAPPHQIFVIGQIRLAPIYELDSKHSTTSILFWRTTSNSAHQK
jgi:hypothetical protein